jgi:predicted AlkP superfamily pyrophosphatase or phosphodiesterase
MRPTPLFAALLLVSSTAMAQGHVAVISVDGLGARELFGAPSCMSSAPTIRALAERGATSHGVRGVLPAITYPAHATISTGTLPTRHGVHDNGLRGVWFKDRSAIKGTTLWDAARTAGRSVAIVTWPSTYGASADWLVPEDLDNFAVPTEALRAGSTPGLFDALAGAVGAPALMPFTHPEAGTPLDAMTARFAAEVVRRHKPALLLAHFLDYDHRMHASPWSAEACAALARTDAWIAHILAAYRAAGILERTTVFIVSDHGFLEVKRRVSLFPLLRAAGWDRLFPGVEASHAFDLKLAGGSAAFYPGPRHGADWPRRLEALRPRVERIAGGALRWITPERARSMGGFPGALFVLCAEPGYAVSAGPPTQTDIWVGAGTRGAHGYCPDEPAMNGLFIASGHGVRRAGAIRRMSMTDVGPTIASFLGASMPAATGSDRSGAFRVRSSRARDAGR